MCVCVCVCGVWWWRGGSGRHPFGHQQSHAFTHVAHQCGARSPAPRAAAHWVVYALAFFSLRSPALLFFATAAAWRLALAAFAKAARSFFPSPFPMVGCLRGVCGPLWRLKQAWRCGLVAARWGEGCLYWCRVLQVSANGHSQPACGSRGNLARKTACSTICSCKKDFVHPK